jgi:uncharacterized protein (DUF433 family)
MTFVESRYEHILLDGDVAYIDDMPPLQVSRVIEVHLAHGWNPRQLQSEFPSLWLDQIYSALAYYWDHKDTLETQSKQEVAVNNSAFVQSRQIHVVLDEKGLGYVINNQGETLSMYELMTLQYKNKWGVEELHHALPQFTMGQLYAALGYYWERETEAEDDLAAQSGT